MFDESRTLETARSRRLRTQEMIRRSCALISESRELMQQLERERGASLELLDTFFEVRGSVDENRRDLNRTIRR